MTLNGCIGTPLTLLNVERRGYSPLRRVPGFHAHASQRRELVPFVGPPVPSGSNCSRPQRSLRRADCHAATGSKGLSVALRSARPAGCARVETALTDAEIAANGPPDGQIRRE